MSLITIDTDMLEEEIHSLQSSISTLQSDVEDKMDHDAVQDTIQEWLNDNDYVTGSTVGDAVNEALDSLDYQDSTDVQTMIDRALRDGDYVDEDRVQEMIDAAITDDVTVKDLERRLDKYAQHTDQLRDERGDLVVRLDALQAKLDALTTESTQALSLLDLLRQAYRIIVGLKFNA